METKNRTTRMRWIRHEGEAACICDALDAGGRPLLRVVIRVADDVREAMRFFLGESAAGTRRMIEADARAMALANAAGR